MSARRWACEGRRFLDVDAGPGEDRDGKVAWSLVYWGWDVSHVRSDDGGCLFDHNPNAHARVASGEDWVWFERERACVRKAPWKASTRLPCFTRSRLPAGTARGGACGGLGRWGCALIDRSERRGIINESHLCEFGNEFTRCGAVAGGLGAFHHPQSAAACLSAFRKRRLSGSAAAVASMVRTSSVASCGASAASHKMLPRTPASTPPRSRRQNGLEARINASSKNPIKSRDARHLPLRCVP